jgi:RNA polymerase sigma-70 factor (ECF subfamily)
LFVDVIFYIRTMANTESIWQEFGGALNGFIKKRIENPDDAKDILQEVFYKIHSGIDSLNEESRLQPWIYRITRNTIADYYRSRAEPSQLATELPNTDESASTIDIESILACLRPMLSQLPDKYRTAIELTDFDGLTQQQLADKMEISLSGAKSRVQRARAMMKETMLACCHFEFDQLGNVLEYERRPGGCLYCDSDKN